jgi:hypothetical protein
MPKVWLSYDYDHGEYHMLDFAPTSDIDSQVVAVEMNGSLYRQIRAAERKFWKFQNVLEKFHREAHQHPDTVRRVR